MDNSSAPGIDIGNSGCRSALFTRRVVLYWFGALLLSGGAAAQPRKPRRIACLSPGSRAFTDAYFGKFRQGLRGIGYSDQDMDIDIRYADGHTERLSDLLAELLSGAPEVIVAAGAAAAQKAKEAASTIPIVMVGVGDPVAAGLVPNLTHPGGNLTGVSTIITYDIAGKWVQRLTETMPDIERVAMLMNSTNSQHAPYFAAARQAAAKLRTELLSVEIRSVDEIEGAFATVASERAQALIVPGDPMFLSERSRIIALAMRQKVPVIYSYRDYAVDGGLICYGTDLYDVFRRASIYVDKILKGAKPGDLPVEQPTKFELIVNLRTARALGLAIPQSILARADEVID
jgi:putative ABC transport system substrate-binding protein